jgi:hypothetical protein
MYDRMPDAPGINLSHVVGGFAVLAMTPVYGGLCVRGAGASAASWLAVVRRDRKRYRRHLSRRQPTSERWPVRFDRGLLLAVVLAAVTGAAWFAVEFCCRTCGAGAHRCGAPRQG